MIWKPGILNYDNVIEYMNSSATHIHDRCDKELEDKIIQIVSVSMMQSNHPETTGMEELDQETNTVTVLNPKYQKMRGSLLTPQISKKMK